MLLWLTEGGVYERVQLFLSCISELQYRICESHIQIESILLSLFYGLFERANEKPAELLMNALWSRLFVIGVLITVGIVTKFIGHMSSQED